jgi:beta-lactamase superfamily II metal-dependent hydrolase
MNKAFILLLLASLPLVVSTSCVTPAGSPSETPYSQTPALEEPIIPPDKEEHLLPTEPTTPPRELGELKVHFIDVGQGDSILIDLADKEILIDGGDRSPGITSYIDKYIDGELDIMCATHPHTDHIGGLISVLYDFQVGEIWHNGDSSNSQTYAEFMACVNSETSNIRLLSQGNMINVKDLAFTVINPATLAGTTNNNSIVMSLNYGDIDFLFTGDAEKEAEGAMLISSIVPVPEVEILKVGHHGSHTACSQDFLTLTSPEVAIYMAGTGNRYGHPHEETIVALSNIGAEIYGTDIHGTIIITTDGKTYDIHLENDLQPVPAPGTASPSPDGSQEPLPAYEETPSEVANVQITRIFYDGLVYRVESDEYVEITNLGNEAVDLAGWVLRDESEGYPEFTFPPFVLQAGEIIRVYTNENHPEYGGFSFGYGKAVWNNKEPDTAALYDDQGQEVSRTSY